LRYANSCRATSRSSSLDETGRLEIGQNGSMTKTAEEKAEVLNQFF